MYYKIYSTTNDNKINLIEVHSNGGTRLFSISWPEHNVRAVVEIDNLFYLLNHEAGQRFISAAQSGLFSFQNVAQTVDLLKKLDIHFRP